MHGDDAVLAIAYTSTRLHKGNQMKVVLRNIAFFASLASSFSIVQAGDMRGMGMKEIDTKAKNGMQMESQLQKGHEAQGMVKLIDAGGGRVTITHGPVAALNWQAMTMTFKLKDKSLLKKLEVGKNVDFRFVQQGDDYVVTELK